MSALQVVNAAYQIGSTQIGRNDCIVYRIMVKNMGEYPLTNVEVSDMYPAYTTPWNSNNVLPMKESGEKLPLKVKVSQLFSQSYYRISKRVCILEFVCSHRVL